MPAVFQLVYSLLVLAAISNYYADAFVSSLVDFKHCLLMAVGSGD